VESTRNWSRFGLPESRVSFTINYDMKVEKEMNGKVEQYKISIVTSRLGVRSILDKILAECPEGYYLIKDMAKEIRDQPMDELRRSTPSRDTIV